MLSALLWGNLGLLKSSRSAWRNYKLSGPYLLGILLAMVLDVVLRSSPLP